ncbi:MAG TPA: DNA internalization-related competence protein ComEC/Rec2 [Smithellaceae bacterium]
MRRPLIYPLIAFIAGIIASSYFAVPSYLLFAGIPLIIFFLILTSRKKWSFASFILVIIFSFFLGSFAIQKHQYLVRAEKHISKYINAGKLTLEGLVIENPISYTDKNVLIVRCLRQIKDKSYEPVSGDIRLVIPSDLNFQYGDFIRFHSALKKIQSFQNPGGFDYERYMNLQGIYATGFIANSSNIILLRQNTASGIRLKLETFRLYLKQIIYQNASTPQREIIEAMTIGNQNAIPADVRDNFNKTGTSHILSISGLHIGMVAATIFFIISLILKSSEYLMLRFNIIKLASAAAFLMVLIYALIAGMGVTVIRSALMALVFLIALFLGRQKDIFNALALTALIILVISPEALFDISFQLSFTSVLAIIYIVPRFSNFSFPLLASLPVWWQKIIRHIFLSILVCIAATLGTIPLIVFYFNRVSAITIIANLIAVPLLGTIALVFSMAFILGAFFSPVIAGFFIKISSFFVQISVYIIDFLASLSWSSFSFTKPNFLEIFIFYLFVFLLVQFIDMRKNKERKKGFLDRYPLTLKYLLIISLVLIIANGIYLLSKDKFSNDLKITAIDVGQGSSTLVRFPGGVNMLIDGGGFTDSSFDMGKLVIAPFLYHERISTIDTVVLTHPHPDHLHGLLYITENFNVKEVWSTGQLSEDEIFQQWQKIIAQKKIKINLISAQSPTAKINGVQLNVLWPLKPPAINSDNLSDNDLNDTSLVLKIKYGNFQFLLPADISSNTEKTLIQRGSNLKSDVLFVPHHGSAHSSCADFIKKVSCRYAVISAGKANVFHHPHPSTLEQYKSAQVQIFRTDKDGAITLTTDGIKLNIDTFRKSR